MIHLGPGCLHSLGKPPEPNLMATGTTQYYTGCDLFCLVGSCTLAVAGLVMGPELARLAGEPSASVRRNYGTQSVPADAAPDNYGRATFRAIF
ncbi:jg18752 [Pararge aegeria aegeria]|uniref:Jg18752 protein n=1 Tax=Pararge aegeria aegeria TaxID=348720 RepID=A0A8S4QV85_9NEOP|nr:jg18752 [Pararge aegeria aegeria]